MEALVAVLLWRVDIVRYPSRLLLEAVGKHRVYFQCHVLLRDILGSLKHHLGEMAVLQMIEVIAKLMHLAPQAVRLAVFHIHLGVNPLLPQDGTDIITEMPQALALKRFIAGYGS